MSEEREGRGAYVLSQLYYYIVAVVGVGLLIGGGVAALFGIRTVAFPREFETTREGIRGVLFGLAFALPGLALLWTHLREARRREGGPFTQAFWGTSLYYHLVALISLVFVLIGVIGILGSLVDLAYPSCYGVESVAYGAGGALGSDCHPPASEALRQMLDFAIFLAVAGPVFWWHLRQGRRATGGPTPGPS